MRQRSGVLKSPRCPGKHRRYAGICPNANDVSVNRSNCENKWRLRRRCSGMTEHLPTFSRPFASSWRFHRRVQRNAESAFDFETTKRMVQEPMSGGDPIKRPLDLSAKKTYLNVAFSKDLNVGRATISTSRRLPTHVIFKTLAGLSLPIGFSGVKTKN
jgi:hypothetical protein